MNQFYVTCYRGYSKVIGQIEFCKFFEQIGSNLHRRKIEQIEMALNEDNLTKADSIKRQLPFYTLTTNYSECRLPHSLSAYNDLPVLDFDEMRQEDIPRLRRLAEEDPATIACALSPRRHGLKLLVYLQTEEAMRLRTELKAKGCVAYAELEQYHKRMFELSSHYYSELLDS
ncbi:virulence protein E, partial [Bacteroides ovatus]